MIVVMTAIYMVKYHKERWSAPPSSVTIEIIACACTSLIMAGSSSLLLCFFLSYAVFGYFFHSLAAFFLPPDNYFYIDILTLAMTYSLIGIISYKWLHKLEVMEE
jgi:hypothetical protein